MRIRPTVRLLVIDPQQRILLFKIEDNVPLDPAHPDMTVYWVTPGGGVDPGETFEQAGLRELWEETGIRAAALGPWVGQRSRVLHFPDEQVQFAGAVCGALLSDAGCDQPGSADEPVPQ